MKYMMLIAGDEDAWTVMSDAERDGLMDRIRTWWNGHAEAGRIVEGHQLQPVATATTVRPNGASGATVTDGPFIDAKEAVGGYGILDVESLDAAIAIASEWPGPDVLEIRPVVERAG